MFKKVAKNGRCFRSFFQPHFLNYATDIFSSVNKAKSCKKILCVKIFSLTNNMPNYMLLDLGSTPEMKFLDIIWTKELSLAAIHSPFYFRLQKKTILFSGFKKSLQINLRNKKTQVYSWIKFCRWGKWGWNNQTKTRVSEDSRLCPKTSTKNAPQDFHLYSIYNYILLQGSNVKILNIRKNILNVTSTRICGHFGRSSLFSSKRLRL